VVAEVTAAPAPVEQQQQQEAAPAVKVEPSTQPEQPYRLDLKLACRDLPKADTKSLSDPMVVVFSKPLGAPDDAYKFVGQTETVMNNHGPNFQTTIGIELRNGDVDLKIGAYDADSKSANDMLGVAFTRASVLNAQGGGEFALLLASGAPANPDPSKRARVVMNAPSSPLDGGASSSAAAAPAPAPASVAAPAFLQPQHRPTPPTSPQKVGFFKRHFGKKKK
jgi:hypothetical protein